MRRIFWLSLAIVCLLFEGVSAADVPHFVNFQGRLNDTTGNPVTDGAHAITFRFLDAPTGGNVLWQEAQNIITVKGLFSVLLGTVDSIPTYVFNADSCFLEIEPQGSSPLTPRARITSVGYAFRAHNADLLSGAPLGVVAQQGDIDAKIAAHAAISDAHHPKTVSASELIVGTLAKERLPKDAIDSSNLADNAVTAAKILDEPGISHSYSGLTPIATTIRVIDSATVVVPAWGYVLVLASGWFYDYHVTNGVVSATLSISGSRTIHDNTSSAKFNVNAADPAGNATEDFMIQRVLTVGPGELKLFLLGSMTGNEFPNVQNVHVNTLFFPTSYGEIDVLKQ